MNRAELIQAILDTASADEAFLFNDCDGLDLMMDAVAAHVKKMKKSELVALHEAALESIYYAGNVKGPQDYPCMWCGSVRSVRRWNVYGSGVECVHGGHCLARSEKND